MGRQLSNHLRVQEKQKGGGRMTWPSPELGHPSSPPLRHKYSWFLDSGTWIGTYIPLVPQTLSTFLLGVELQNKLFLAH